MAELTIKLTLTLTTVDHILVYGVTRKYVGLQCFYTASTYSITAAHSNSTLDERTFTLLCTEDVQPATDADDTVLLSCYLVGSVLVYNCLDDCNGLLGQQKGSLVCTCPAFRTCTTPE